MSSHRAPFGPSQEEIWRQLSVEIGGQYVDGGFWEGDKVVARTGPWTTTLDTCTRTVDNSSTPTTYTRLRAPFVNPDGFRFAIYRKHLFSGLGRLLGLQDIEIGEPFFDEEFVIKGNSDERVRALFANPRLRESIHRQPDILLEIHDDEGWFGADFPEGVDMLTFEAAETIEDVSRLKALFDLFGETLRQLCRIGSAYADDPGVTL
jgi:hypothetical protein